MHKHKRHGRKHVHMFFPGGMIWWFIFAMMFMKGDSWPWILVAVGFWYVFGSFFQEEKRPPELKTPPAPNFIPMPPPITRPDPTPAEPIHRADLLPATCSQCGGPISPYEVKWKGTHAAACPYCGSNLKMK